VYLLSLSICNLSEESHFSYDWVFHVESEVSEFLCVNLGKLLCKDICVGYLTILCENYAQKEQE